MERRRIPGTDIDVAVFALGGWLTLGDRLDDDASRELLQTAVDSGIDLIDLADVYGGGGAERVVGAFLRTVPRQRLVIASKVFWPTSDRPEDRGLSRRHIMAAIDASLARLGTDYLDLYYCHREDPGVPLAETVQAMGDLVRAGKVRAWGTSCWQPSTLQRAHALAAQLGVAPPRVEQPEYHLLERGVEARVVPLCQRLGMGIVPFSPLAGGVLTGKYLEGTAAQSRGATTNWNARYLTPLQQTAVAAFVAACRARGVAPAVAALAWLVRQPGVTSVLLGASRPEQLRQNLAAASHSFGAEGWDWVSRCVPRPPRSWWRRLLRRFWRRR